MPRGVDREVERAERLRLDTLSAVSQYEAQLAADLRLFKRQRAWRVMLYLRKAYTVLVRSLQSGRLPSPRSFLSLVLTPSKDLDSYDLRLPVLRAFLPPGLEHSFLDSGPPAATTTARGPLRMGNRVPGEPPQQQHYDVLVLPVFEFDFRFQRPQQLAIQFARAGHRVFWISPSRTCSTDEPYEAILLRPGIWEIRLASPLPNIYFGKLGAEHVNEAIHCLGAVYRDFATAASCALVLLPFWRRLARQLQAEFDTKIVYDCMDDWQTMPGISAFNRSEEPSLADEADALTVTAEQLAERHRAAGREPVLVRNGANYQFFAAASTRDYLKHIRRPIIGYFGAIADWFDYSLVYEAARLRPEYSFVLIGGLRLEDKPAHREAVQLGRLPNVHLLGHKPYCEMPGYLAEFDACMIPFVLNPVTNATDPVKLYEYLSQGKPVIATPMGELRQYSDLIYTAARAEEFAAAIDTALKEEGSGLRSRRIEFAAGQDWEVRWRTMDETIRAVFPLISILIVTHNSAEYVSLCMESLRRNTFYPAYEVIVVDNGSSDSTVEILAGVAERDSRIRVLAQHENLGFAGGNNRAAKEARGDYLVLLNIDTILSAGWLERLLRHCVAHPENGIVIPVTNNIGNEAKISVAYRNREEMERFALAVASEHFGESIDLRVAPLFCALTPRTVWNQVGALDERFHVGMFEDDDFSLRVRKAGYRIVAAEDCFVHHFGQGSFAKLAASEYHEIFAANRRFFEEKWREEWIPHKYRPGVSAEEGRFSPTQFLGSQHEEVTAVSATRARSLPEYW